MKLRIVLSVALAVALCGAANAQFSTGFEDYAASPGGTLLTGQNGWYQPVAGGIDDNVYTYAGNVLGMSANPQGGANFIGSQSQGGALLGRAQRDNNFGAHDVWTVSFDMNGKYNGTLPTADYLGSFSLQPSATNTYFQTLNTWADPNTATAFNTNYISAEHAVPGVAPGPAWQNLTPDHWYRLSTTFDFTTSLIMQVTIQDLTAGGPLNVVDNPGWHLVAGNGTRPTAFRFFTGGGAGNAMGWDNVSVVPEPASLFALGLLALALRRR